MSARLDKIIEDKMFHRCLWCKRKHRCGKAETDACRQEVRDQAEADYNEVKRRIKESK